MRQQPHLWYFLATALGLHLAGGALCMLRGPDAPPPTEPRTTAAGQKAPPAWTLSPRAQHTAIEQARRARQQAALRPAKKAPVRGTVVDLPPSAEHRPPPKESAYLAEHNAVAAKETRSRHSSATHKQAQNEPMAGQDRPEAAAAKPPSSSSRADRVPDPDASAQAGGGAAHVPARHNNAVRAEALDRLRLPERPDGAQLKNQAAQPKASNEPLRLRLGPEGPHVAPGPNRGEVLGPGAGPGAKAQGQPALSMAQLVPDVATLSRLGGGPKNDVSLDVPEGEGTFLNAREFKYASFFNRIKEQISNHWRPLPEYERRDPSGHIYGLQNRMTVLTIALDDQGGLEQLDVAQSSGIDFLDEEGLRAIRAAAPFVHPPKGLLDDNRRIVFKFGFSIDVSGSGYRGLP